jgi:methylthioribose-1-phosphate isomerase
MTNEPKNELQTVCWENGKVRLLDQNSLPNEVRYLDFDRWQDVVDAIRIMTVRGAPAIGATAALGLALAARQIEGTSREDFLIQLDKAAWAFKGARPTAVNLFWAIDRLMKRANASEGEGQGGIEAIRKTVLEMALLMLGEDVDINRRLGAHGAALLPDEGRVITHCNAGALATVGHGTALGVVRSAVEFGKKIHVFADETRPRLQGMKLTAWELQRDGIPVTIVADNMAAVLLREKKADCVIVGADRIAANGDTANKIGTYGLAVQAHFHGVPFYVAAPLSTIDFDLQNGTQIPIEERDPTEMTHAGETQLAPFDVPVWNPAFDVTPAHLITAIITENGIARAPFEASLQELRTKS